MKNKETLKNNPKMAKTLPVVLTVLSFINLFACAFIITRDSIGMLSRLACIFTVIAIASILAYMLNGYKKAVSFEYKIFTFFHCGAIALGIVDLASQGVNALSVIMMLLLLVSYGCSFTVSFGKDLGRKQSLSFAQCAVVALIISTVISLFKAGALLGSGDMAASVSKVLFASCSLNAVSLWFATFAKYSDKKEREIEKVFSTF